jgi:hypothetical protein
MSVICRLTGCEFPESLMFAHTVGVRWPRVIRRRWKRP